MAVALIESLLEKAKESSEEEIDNLCTGINDLLLLPDRSGECCSLLRQLFVILQASDQEVQGIQTKIIENMMQAVQALPSSQKVFGGVGKCALCQMILNEVLPQDTKADSNGSNSPQKNTSKSQKPAMKKSKCLAKLQSEVVRWLHSQDFGQQKSGLAILTTICLLHAKALEVGVINETSEKMAHWLSSASLLQAANPHAINPFRKDQDSGVTEIDGCANTNIFTALNIGQYYTDDQFMNIYSFSLLYKWFLSANSSVQTKKEEVTPQNAEVGISEGKGQIQIQEVMSSLVPKSVDYCFRIIDQSERKAKVQSDSELQIACLLEAVRVLDTICSLDSNQTARVFQEIKRLNSRIIDQSAHSPVLIAIIKFFFHHSNTVVHDPQETFHHFFTTVVSNQLKDQALMYDTVDFLYSNISEIAYTTGIFTSYFPNLFKIVAWHPDAFIKEIMSLLPSMMNWDTSIELFHLILDLPCMAAALEVTERAKRADQEMSSFDAEPTSSLDAYFNPRFRPLFTYVTRAEGGQGDTIDRLGNLHQVLKDCILSPRVIASSKLVPVFLKIWFETVLVSEDTHFLAQLIPVILERSGLIFSIPELISSVHKVMRDDLLVLCKHFPGVVTHQREEILEFLQTTANMDCDLTLYANVIYAVGEYCSPSHSTECTSDIISQYFEGLEVLTYEVLTLLGAQEQEEGVSVQRKDGGVPKVISCLMSALAQLSSRCQDLIPRTILCLTKVAKQPHLSMLPGFIKDTLVNKATDLINVLKNPELSTILLNPGPEIYTARWHLNNTSRPAILRGIHRLMKK